MERDWVVSFVADHLYGADFVDRRYRDPVSSDRASPRGGGD